MEQSTHSPDCLPVACLESQSRHVNCGPHHTSGSCTLGGPRAIATARSARLLTLHRGADWAAQAAVLVPPMKV